MGDDKQTEHAPASDPAVGCSAWLGRLSHVSTLEELHDVRLCELVPNVHIIVGDGGRCMCGMYGGVAIHCADILKSKSPDFMAALLQFQMLTDHGGEVWRPNDKLTDAGPKTL